MAQFPLCAAFEGDFVLQLVAVDTENTMDEVAAAAAYHTVGRRIADRPGSILRVRKPGEQVFFPRTLKVSESGLLPTECVEIIWEAARQQA